MMMVAGAGNASDETRVEQKSLTQPGRFGERSSIRGRIKLPLIVLRVNNPLSCYALLSRIVM